MSEDPPYLPVQFAFASAIDHARLSPDLVGVSANLTLSDLRWGYLHGAFPMGLGPDGQGVWGWWSPQQRGVLPAADVKIRRSLRQSAKKLRLTCNKDFAGVLAGCADPQRDGRWINDAYTTMYLQLRERGEVHSLEVWDGSSLVGGLISVGIGWIVAGESMFFRQRDASKVALWGLCRLLASQPSPIPALIDVQWPTEHLVSMGAQEVPDHRYAAELRRRRAFPGGWSWPEGADITELIRNDATFLDFNSGSLGP